MVRPMIGSRSRRRTVSASSTTTTPSRSKPGVSAWWATGPGSAMPLASMTTCSGGSGRSRTVHSAQIRSLPTEQQMHPLVSVIV